MDGYKISIDKFCIDDPDEKAEYEELINSPETRILEERMITSVGRHIRAYKVVRWCTPECTDLI